MRATISVCLIAMAGLFNVGCVSTRPAHYYSLAPAAAPPNQGPPDGPTILVGTIATPEYLQDARIRYRTGTNEVGAYEYHRWTERPAAMVRYSLVRALRSSGKYRRVLESSSSVVGDYQIVGKLYEFCEEDNPAIQTTISLHLELIDTRTNRYVWDRSFEHQEPAAGKNIKDVVQSMDRNLQQVVSEASAEIGRFLGGGL
jgi:ABC-type uncharacterized transport system auxiliary subunit